MLATVPASGATTGISIFIASRIRTASPFSTLSPTFFSSLNTLPAAPASILMLPAPVFAAGAGAAAFGAATGAAALLGAEAEAALPFSSTVTSYTFPFTVIGF